MKKSITFIIITVLFCSCSLFRVFDNKDLESEPIAGVIRNDSLIVTNTFNEGNLDFKVIIKEGRDRLGLNVNIMIKESRTLDKLGYVKVYKVTAKGADFFSLKKIGETKEDGTIRISKSILEEGILVSNVGFRPTYIYIN